MRIPITLSTTMQAATGSENYVNYLNKTNLKK